MIHRYHDGTKHHFHGFARSLGSLDWASQPNPFGQFIGAPTLTLYPLAGGARSGAMEQPQAIAYDDLFAAPSFRARIDSVRLGDRLRHALWWPPRIHLALFVHRVDAVEPGGYLLVRDETATERLRGGFDRDFLWERADEAQPFWRLARGDCRTLAQRLSCDQAIASDGFFSLAMVAEFDASLATFGPSLVIW